MLFLFTLIIWCLSSYFRIPLMIAIAKKNFIAVCALINFGSDVKADDDVTFCILMFYFLFWRLYIYYWTSLHYAAQAEDSQILKMILDFGGDPNAADFEGATPLHIAGDLSNEDNIAYLIQAGADPSIRNNFSVKAYDICMNRGHEKAFDPNYFNDNEVHP